MKTVFFAVTALLCLSAETYAQDYWKVLEPIDINKPDYNAVLGLKNKRSLNLVTNDTTRLAADSLGNIRIPSLVNTAQMQALGLNEDTYGRFFRLVYVDGNGNLSAGRTGLPPNLGIPSQACLPNAMPWYEGGNEISANGSNLIGPCSSHDFILQANARKIITLTQAGNVGMGENNSAPAALLDISEPVSSGTRHHLRAYGNAAGYIEATHNLQLFYGNEFRLSLGSAAGTANEDKLVADAGGLHLMSDVDFYGSSFSLNTGNFNVNTRFTVAGASGKTSIGSQPGAGNTAMLSVNVNGASVTDALDVYDQATGKVNFRVKANGVVYLREANVQLTDFPDYVFSPGYPLKSLESLDAYICRHRHLPNVPTAGEVAANGANLGELSRLQMEKIEELTLYIIALNKKLAALEAKVNGN